MPHTATPLSLRAIVVAGSANVDLMLSVPHLPKPGETVAGGGFATEAGGKGANQAVAAAKLGAPVVFVGCVGGDAFGTQAIGALAATGVDVTHLHVLAGHTTGVAMVLNDAAGENCIALDPGANDRLAPAHVDGAVDAIANAALLICQLESPLATVAHALQTARWLGVPALLNPAPAQALPDELLQGLRFLVPNALEASLMTGIEVTDAASAERAARQLRERGVDTVLLTRGADGVTLVDASGVEHFPGRRVQAVDSTGAGDTFVGAFASAWRRGLPVAQAVEFAQGAAAFSVCSRGAQASMPTQADAAADFAQPA